MREEELNKQLYETEKIVNSPYGVKTENEFRKDIMHYLDISNSDGLYLNNFLDLEDSNIDLDYNMNILSKVNTDFNQDNYREDSDVPYIDTDWITSKFLVPWDNMKDDDKLNSLFTWARTKTEDSSLGNHSVINPLPQFTRYADPRVTVIQDRQKNVDGGTKMFAMGLGMGRYYSEAIDDYQQTLFLQFGMPEFNSMFSFLTNAVTYEDAYIANHGRYPVIFGATSWLGARLVFGVYPWLSLAIWVTKFITKLAFGFNPFTYYFLNPNMTNYWGSVNTIVSSMAVELGLFVPTVLDNWTTEEDKLGDSSKRMGVPVALDEGEMKQLNALIPGLINEDGYIDVYKIATTHQTMATKYRQRMMEEMEKSPNEYVKNLAGYLLADDFVVNDNSLKDMVANKVKNSAYGDSPKSWFAKALTDLQTDRMTLEKLGDKLASRFNEFKGMLAFLMGRSGDLDEKGYYNTDMKNGEKKAKLFIDSAENTGYDGTTPTTDAYKQRDEKQVQNEEKEKDEKKQKTIDAENTEKSKKPEDRTSADAKLAAAKDKASSQSNYGTSAEYVYDGNPVTIKSDGYNNNQPFSIPFYNSMVETYNNWMSQAGRVADAVMRDGGLFLGLRVNAVKSVDDSFSNSTGPIQTGELLKSVSGTVRNANFMLSGGNILPGMGDVISAAKQAVTGLLDGASFGLSSVVMSALEGAYVDIPDKWEESSCNISTVSYSMKLISPYGNPISQLQNIYIPLACLLAGVLPLATGRSSHTSPYLCSVFSQGVQNIELGIITELSISRGTSNLPFSKWKKPLAIDVNFSVANLSNIITTPINRGVLKAFLQGGITEVGGQLTTESKLDDYIGTLCGRDLNSARFVFPKLQRRLKKAKLKMKQAFNPNQFAMMIGEVLNTPAGAAGIAMGSSAAKRIFRNVYGTRD